MEKRKMNNRRKTVFKYVFPALLTNACFFLFTVVDGIFVGNGVGTNALGAVNIAYPLIMIALALNMMTSIGGVTVVAIRLGRGDTDGANKAFMHSFSATAILSVVLMLLGTLATEPLAVLLGADEMYLPMVKEYLFWYCVFAIPTLLNVNLQGFCRNDGSPMLVGIATVISTVMNIFLDWLFVFPLQLGLMGAAVATGISQTASFLIVLSHFLLKKGKLRIRKEQFDKKLLGKVLYRGTPEMIAQFATPVMTICYNRVLIAQVGDIGINAFSIISYVASFAMSVMFGASEGFQPLFGQSYGAKDKESLNFYLREAMIVALVGSAVCVSGAVLFSSPICALFGADTATLAYTVEKMPQFAWGFIVAGLNTVVSAYFYSTKQSAWAIALNTIRSFVFSTATILLLPLLFQSEIIWYTFGIYESLVLIVSVSMLLYTKKKLLS